jgi:hypothetical protein
MGEPRVRQHRHTARRGVERSATLRRSLIWIASAAGVLLIASAVWIGVRGWIAKGELEAVVPLSQELKAAALANNPADVSRLASALHDRTSVAENLTSDPVWRLGEFVPALGPNLTAVRQVSSALQGLSSDAVGPLTRLLSSIDIADLKPSDGSIDLEPIAEAQPAVRSAQTALEEADESVRAIDVSATVGPVKSAVTQLRRQLGELLPPVDALYRTVSLVPSMLGQGDPRDYLVIFQNPAELRATGGISGAMALVHADGGRVSLIQQASSSDFPHYAQSVLPLPDETRGLYGDIIGEYIQDVNLTPNFELSAKLAQKMWAERFGQSVDGVISVDPVALSYILGATGPVQTVTGDELTDQTVVPLLLSQVYSRYPDPAQQDLFFASAASAVFEKVSSGALDSQKFVSSLSRASTERRILVWSADATEEGLLAETTMAGALPGAQDDSPRLGLYLNDATGAKMDYYLGVDTAIGSTSCRKDGRQYIALSVTLTNRAPSNAATALPPYVTGGGVYGVTPGNVKTMLAVYGSPKMANLGVARDGTAVSAHAATDLGRPVSQIAVELEPGQSATYTFGFLGSDRKIRVDQLQQTPIINMNETSELAPDCESALW